VKLWDSNDKLYSVNVTVVNDTREVEGTCVATIRSSDQARSQICVSSLGETMLCSSLAFYQRRLAVLELRVLIQPLLDADRTLMPARDESVAGFGRGPRCT
jgi:hypothetical protein